MNERLGSLARFAEVEGVRRVESLRIQSAWLKGDGESLFELEAQYADGDVILQPHPRYANAAAVILHGREFLAMLTWLIRQGLLENVGLVSTEPVGVDDSGPHQCRCVVVPAGDAKEMDPRFHGGDGAGEGQRLVTMTVDEEEGETELDDPFGGDLDLVEGEGRPEWLNFPTLMRYLHHDLELSASDIAKLCDTTYARVKGALKRHGIEQRRQQGGRSKIEPRLGEPASTER